MFLSWIGKVYSRRESFAMYLRLSRLAHLYASLPLDIYLVETGLGVRPCASTGYAVRRMDGLGLDYYVNNGEL